MNSEIFFSNKESENLSTHTDARSKSDSSYLHRKTKREIFSYGDCPEKRCDICLESEKYSQSKLIECINCRGVCHKKCLNFFNEDIIPPMDGIKNDFFIPQEFECNRCSHSKIMKIDSLLLKYFNILKFRCSLCGEFEGILNKFGFTNEFVHFKCVRFFSEFFENKKSPLNLFTYSDLSIENKLRKWRNKNQCKICKCKEVPDHKKCVIKCVNTKCKSYFHISCAIRKNLIIPLEFMSDYYGFKSTDNNSMVIPFYCSQHNRNLIEAYQSYVNQLDQLLDDSGNEANEIEDSKMQIKEFKSDNGELSFFNLHISDNTNTCISKNFNSEFKFDSHKIIDVDEISINSVPIEAAEEDFNLNNNNITEKENIFSLNTNLKNYILPQKPKYNIDDSCIVSLNLPTFYPPEYNFINIENNNNFNLNFDNSTNDCLAYKLQKKSNNFNSFSMPFYEFFDNDIEKIQSSGVSNVTLTQLQFLKQFFIRVLKNYNKFDLDLEKIYTILQKDNFI